MEGTRNVAHRLFDVPGAASRLARRISDELGYDEDRREVLAFGLQVLLSAVLDAGLVLLVAAVFGVARTAAWAIVVGGGLRAVSSGGHCSSAGRCAVLTAITYIPLALAAEKLLDGAPVGLMLALCAASFTFLLLAAPPGGLHEERNARLRPFAFSVVAVYTTFVLVTAALQRARYSAPVVAAGLAMFWQSFTVTRVGRMVVAGADSILKTIGIE